MLAIAGGKGGCGKTTTALGLASELGRMGQSPLVADADRAMPDLHIVADVPLSPGLPAVADGACPATVAHALPEEPSVSVVPTAGIDESELVTALERLRHWNGPTLLDCPAGAARDAAIPLRTADKTVLVTTPTPDCLRDTAKTAAMARTLGTPPVGVVVVTREASHTHADCLTDADAHALFECPVLAHIPAASENPLSDGSVRTMYQTLAKKMLERNI